MINLREDDAEVLCSVDLEVLLVFAVLGDSRPSALGGRTHDTEDADELVFVGCSGEEGAAAVHLCHDAAGGPDVDAGAIGAGTEENIRGTVPEGDDFVREGVDGNAESTGQTEICKLELTFVVDKEILRLEIAVKNSVFVAEIDSLEQLIHV